MAGWKPRRWLLSFPIAAFAAAFLLVDLVTVKCEDVEDRTFPEVAHLAALLSAVPLLVANLVLRKKMRAYPRWRRVFTIAAVAIAIAFALQFVFLGETCSNYD